MHLILTQRMFTHLTSIILFFTFCTASYAQTEGSDIVELKNGRIHQGIIIEQRPGYFLKLLQRPINDTLKIEYSDIVSIRITPQEKTGETEAPLMDSSNLKNQLNFNKKVYSMLVRSIIGTGNWTYYGLGVGVLRKFTPRIQAGIGFNAIESLENNIGYTSRTVFGEFKYALQQSSSGRTSLLLSVAIGPNFYSRPTQANGIYLNPNIGYRINVTKNMGLIVDLGYQYLGGQQLVQEPSVKLERFNSSSLQLKATLFF